MPDTTLLNIHIGASNYRLNVSSNKESQIRKAVATLNEIITKYKQQFPNQKEHDYIAMAFIEFAANQENNTTDSSDILKSLQEINNKL